MSVLIRLEYFGNYIERVGKPYEELAVPINLQLAYEFIIEYIARNYGIMPPFILMLGKTHIAGALKKQANIPLKDGDTFKFVPSISGG